jgi:tRNA-modifying protein YgfZ
MSSTSSPTASPPTLPYAVLQIQGADAHSFLQGQFTNSLDRLKPLTGGPSVYQRNGYCSAKGRLLAIGRCWQPEADVYRLLVPEEIAEALIKRLRMFVLRAKVTIERADVQVYGLRTPASAQAGSPAGTPTLSVDQPRPGLTRLAQPTATNRANGSTGSTGSTGALHWLVADKPLSSEHLREALPDQETLSPTDWQWQQTAQAEPWIWAATQDRFVPQSINFELLDGVDFQKGCYPGQEVVARSQYLGKLKTRLFAMTADQDPSACPLGSDVWLDETAPVGELVQTAAGTEGRPNLVLVSLDLTAWKTVVQDKASLSCGTSWAQGLTLHAMDQPYAVPLEPNQPVRPKLN